MNETTTIDGNTADPAGGAQRLTILVVEDSPIQAELLRRALEGAGYAVLLANNGAEGLAMAKANHPVAVVSDINMPVMDGYAMCQAIRREDSLKSTPVILLTMLSDPEDVIRGLNAGADAYVTKPYNVPTLVSHVESLLACPPVPPPAMERRKLEIRVAGNTHVVDAHGPRMLNLLISTYENAVLQNRDLIATQQALNDINEHLEEKVLEKTRDLKESEEKFRSITASAPDAIVMINSKGNIVVWNATAERIFGYAGAEVLGNPLVARVVPERFREAHDKGLERFRMSGEGAFIGGITEVTALRKDGTEFPAELTLSAVNAHGERHAIGILRDVTERKIHEQKIARLSRIQAVLSGINSLIMRVRDRQELFNEACRIAVEHGQFGIAWIGTLDPNTLDVNPVAWAGIGAESFPHTQSSARSEVPEGQSAVGHSIRKKQPMIVNDLAADPAVGGPRRKEAIRRGYRSLIILPLLIDDAVVGILALLAQEANFFNEDELKLLNELAGDISFALDHIAKEEKLNYLAYYDALTGLPNRALFDDRMAQHMRAASHEKSKMALVLIDLERFRAVNDTLGRSAADHLLKLVAARLQSVIFDRDSLARVHADVFAGLFPDIKGEADIARIVEEKIIGCLNRPFTLAGQELRVSAKAGVALFPGDATEPDALFSSAEAALRQAKGSSDRYLFYARKMNAQVAERLKLENKLLRALERDEFVLFYQPKVDLSTGRVSGFEALIRWNDPDTGVVLPSLFIPLLEETGMIIEVGAWAMKRAVSQYAAWQARSLKPPRIAVNLSQVQLKRKDCVATVQQAIAIAGHPDHGLDLEITESMIMENIESNIEKLEFVRNLGVGLAIDDFGTGYSSLRYLTRLPVTALKIDRAFIQQMTTNPDDVAIVSAVIALGHNLNLKVIAEGVETEEQSKFLRLLKCNEIQGYLFSKPIPADAVERLLTGAPSGAA